MEYAFNGGYMEGDEDFCISPTNWQGGVESIAMVMVMIVMVSLH